jgi:hypothetical protein
MTIENARTYSGDSWDANGTPVSDPIPPAIARKTRGRSRETLKLVADAEAAAYQRGRADEMLANGWYMTVIVGVAFAAGMVIGAVVW